MNTEIRIERVIRFLNSHAVALDDLPTVVRRDGDHLVVRCAATKDGKSFEEQDRIPATIHAAREWLGY